MSYQFETTLAARIWEQRYRYRQDDRAIDRDVTDTWRRVARAAASVEGSTAGAWEQKFYELIANFRFLPGGRILAAAGTRLDATLLNCFVMGAVEDSIDGIFTALKEGALTMQQGGGVGYDFSTLRPRGSRARASGNIATGPVSFMHVWDEACGTITGSGPRGGAMMATLRCDHPDIFEFIEAKRGTERLSRFNLSVQITDEYIDACAAGREWPLVFPCAALPTTPQQLIVQRRWTGDRSPVPCAVLRTVDARGLWQALLTAGYACGDPGVLFVDTINRENNLHYCERLTTTNPCGELPLPPYGACDLGSFNLARFVREPFTAAAAIDWDALQQAVPLAVRFLDNVLDVSRYPLARQRDEALRSRRIGLGITGLADTLIMVGLRYDSTAARTLAAGILERLRDAAYCASIELASRKGTFGAFERDAYLSGVFIRRLPQNVRDGIARDGIRNAQLLALAPTGSISLLAGNVSSGIEPVFALEGTRRVRSEDGWETYATTDDAWRRFRARNPDATPTDLFVTAHELHPDAHLAMQAALQPFVDGAIAKTINLPTDYPFERYGEIFSAAHRLGLKGCTVFRATAKGTEVLSRARCDQAPR